MYRIRGFHRTPASQFCIRKSIVWLDASNSTFNAPGESSTVPRQITSINKVADFLGQCRSVHRKATLHLENLSSPIRSDGEGVDVRLGLRQVVKGGPPARPPQPHILGKN